MAEVVRKRDRAESEHPRIECRVSEHQISAFLFGIFDSVTVLKVAFVQEAQVASSCVL